MAKATQAKKHLPNKYIYAAFLFASIVFILVKDFSTAIMFCAIGLAFDPFDQSMPFQKRPRWQRLWLMAHCVLVGIVLWCSVKH